MKAIGVTGAQRSQAVPDVPTNIGETLKGYDVPVWYGFVITAKTPVAMSTSCTPRRSAHCKRRK